MSNSFTIPKLNTLKAVVSLKLPTIHRVKKKKKNKGVRNQGIIDKKKKQNLVQTFIYICECVKRIIDNDIISERIKF